MVRLDQTVARLFSDYSRERLKDWINQGHLLVEGKVWRPKDRVVGGETVTLEIMLGSGNRSQSTRYSA